jgi:ferredoxin
MPTISYQTRTTTCPVGTRLRDALLDAGMTPHHSAVSIVNCHGLGTCGTCAVEVRSDPGAVTEPTAIERWRLSFPPHRSGRDLRLACQCRVLGDVEIVKHPGLWGQRRPADTE